MFSLAVRRAALGSRYFGTGRAAQMSHIGSLPIKYTGEVTIEHVAAPFSATDTRFVDTTTLRVTGPLGERTMAIEPFVKLDFVQAKAGGADGSVERELRVSVADSERKRQRQMWGTTRALIGNCVKGVTEGFSATLRFVGVGYRAALVNGLLELRLGYAHPITLEIP
ncbi:54S ribosomal protein L6 mitochondrial, partial [Coemansia spiralis]